MNIFRYLSNYGHEGLQALSKEIIQLLELDIKENVNYTNIETDSKEVIERLCNSNSAVIADVEIMHSIIAGVLQLVKVERAGFKSNLHLASFYNEWKTEGYFSEIEKAIKLPY